MSPLGFNHHILSLCTCVNSKQLEQNLSGQRVNFGDKETKWNTERLELITERDALSEQIRGHEQQLFSLQQELSHVNVYYCNYYNKS